MTEDCRKLFDVLHAVEFLFEAYGLRPGFELKLSLIHEFHDRAVAAKMEFAAVTSMVEDYCSKNSGL